MPSVSQDLFASVPQNDILNLFNSNGEPDAGRIANILNYKRKDVSVATDIPLERVRLESLRIPGELKERIREWGTAINLVANHFKDEKKTILWFQTPNPMLGNVSPREMIMAGRFRKLLKFIQNALDKNR
ncbi:MAG: hypothetical protein ACE5EN_11715 [Nitrospinota bacterium]